MIQFSQTQIHILLILKHYIGVTLAYLINNQYKKVMKTNVATRESCQPLDGQMEL